MSRIATAAVVAASTISWLRRLGSSNVAQSRHRTIVETARKLISVITRPEYAPAGSAAVMAAAASAQRARARLRVHT